MFQKILVALDHSAMSQALFEKALFFAAGANTKVLLLHVLSEEEPDSPLPISPKAEKIYWAPGSEINLERWQQQWEQYASKSLAILQNFADQAKMAGAPVDIQQIAGHAGPVICNVATQWGADLVLVGHRGRTGLKEWVLGSVSNYVLHHAPCSVLTLKVPHS